MKLSSDAFFITHGYRTGSNMIASVLGNNGLGSPAEHFNSTWQAGCKSADSSEKFQAVSDVIKENSSNGIFAAKLPLQDFLALVDSTVGVEQGLEEFTKLFDNVVFLRVSRRDIFAQAVSLWRAKQSDEWFRYGEDSKVARVPPYEFKGVYEAYLYLCREEFIWREIFSSFNGYVEEIYYEDFDKDHTILMSSIQRAADRLNVKPFDKLSFVTGNVRQRDIHSGLFRDRFVQDLKRSYLAW